VESRRPVEYSGGDRMAVPGMRLVAAAVRPRASSRTTQRVLSAVSFALLASSVTLSGQDVPRPRSVLMLFSLRSTAPAVAEMESSFRQTLENGLASPVDFHVEYLDLPDTSLPPYSPQLAELLRAKYASRPMDLIVVQESAALRFLLENRDALFPAVPVVFLDVLRPALEQLRRLRTSPARFSSWKVSEPRMSHSISCRAPNWWSLSAVRLRSTKGMPPSLSVSSRPRRLTSRCCPRRHAIGRATPAPGAVAGR